MAAPAQLPLLAENVPPADPKGRPLPALDHVRRRAVVTIDNGAQHVTFRFAAWARGGRQGSGYDEPELYFVDLDGQPYGQRVTVARVKVYHSAGGARSYRFHPVSGPEVTPALLYAAHVCFLHLTGLDTSVHAWRDVRGVHRQPTDRYTLRPMAACLRCGRKLTAPASIDHALGPECRRAVGIKAAEATRSV